MSRSGNKTHCHPTRRRRRAHSSPARIGNPAHLSIAYHIDGGFSCYGYRRAAFDVWQRCATHQAHCARLLQADPNPGSLTFNGCNPPAMRACVLRIRTAVVASVLRIWHYHRACELCTVVSHVTRRRLPHTPPARPVTTTSVDPCC